MHQLKALLSGVSSLLNASIKDIAEWCKFIVECIHYKGIAEWYKLITECIHYKGIAEW